MPESPKTLGASQESIDAYYASIGAEPPKKPKKTPKEVAEEVEGPGYSGPAAPSAGRGIPDQPISVPDTLSASPEDVEAYMASVGAAPPQRGEYVSPLQLPDDALKQPTLEAQHQRRVEEEYDNLIAQGATGSRADLMWAAKEIVLEEEGRAIDKPIRTLRESYAAARRLRRLPGALPPPIDPDPEKTLEALRRQRGELLGTAVPFAKPGWQDPDGDAVVIDEAAPTYSGGDLAGFTRRRQKTEGQARALEAQLRDIDRQIDRVKGLRHLTPEQRQEARVAMIEGQGVPVALHKYRMKDGQVVEIEKPLGYVLRMLGGISAFAQETAESLQVKAQDLGEKIKGTALDVPVDVAPHAMWGPSMLPSGLPTQTLSQQLKQLGVPKEATLPRATQPASTNMMAGFLHNVFDNVENNKGTQIPQNLVREVELKTGQPQPELMQQANYASLFLEVAVPWDLPVFAGVRVASKTGKAARLAAQAPKGARLDTMSTAIQAQSFGKALVTDVGGIVVRQAARDVEAGRTVSLPARSMADARQYHALKKQPLLDDVVKARAGKKPAPADELADFDTALRDVNVNGRASRHYSDVMDTINGSFARRSREILGDSKMITWHGGGKLARARWLTRREFARITTGVRRQLADAGLDPAVIWRASKGDDAPLTDAQRRAVVDLVPANHPTLPDVALQSTITTKQFNELVDTLIDHAADRSSRVQYQRAQARGTYRRAAVNMIRDLGGEIVEDLVGGGLRAARGVSESRLKQASGKIETMLLRAASEATKLALRGVDFRILPTDISPALRDVVRQTARRIEKSGEDQIRDIRMDFWRARQKGGEFDAAQEILDILQRRIADVWTPLPEVSVAAVKEIKRIGGVVGVKTIDDLRPRLEKVASKLGWKIDPAQTTQHLYDDLLDWQKATSGAIQRTAEQLFKALVPEPDAMTRFFKSVKLEDKHIHFYRLWKKHGIQGVREELEKSALVGAKNMPLPNEVALYRLLTEWTARQRLVHAAEEFLAMGIGLPAKNTKKLEDAVMTRMQGGDIADALLRSQADAYITTWGLRAVDEPLRKAKGQLELLAVESPVVLGGSAHIKLPALEKQSFWRESSTYVKTEFTDAANRAGINLAALSDKQLLNTGQRFWQWYSGLQKSGVTLGLMGAPNFAFGFNNFVQGPFQMTLTLGMTGTMRGIFAAVDPRTATLHRELLGRMAQAHMPFNIGETLGHRVGAKNHLITEAGHVRTVDELAEGAFRFGLDTSYARTQTARSLLNDLAALNPRGLNRVTSKLSNAHQSLQGVAHAQEQFYRVGVYLDHVRRGLPMEESARLAREAMYDYGKMTDLERFTIRKFFFFWSYMRANFERTAHAFMTHPEEATRMVRLLQHDAKAFGVTPLQEASMYDDDSGRLIVAKMNEVRTPGGQRDFRYASELALTYPLPIADSLMQAYAVFNLADSVIRTPFGGRTAPNMTTQESLESLTKGVTPMLHDLSTLRTGLLPDLGSVDYDKRWVVPLKLAEWDLENGRVLARYFDWQSVEEPDLHRPRTHSDRVFVIQGREGKARWHTLMNRQPWRRLMNDLFYASDDTKSFESKVLKIFTGTKMQKVETDDESVRQLKLRRQKEIESEKR